MSASLCISSGSTLFSYWCMTICSSFIVSFSFGGCFFGKSSNSMSKTTGLVRMPASIASLLSGLPGPVDEFAPMTKAYTLPLAHCCCVTPGRCPTLHAANPFCSIFLSMLLLMPVALLILVSQSPFPSGRSPYFSMNLILCFDGIIFMPLALAMMSLFQNLYASGSSSSYSYP